MHKIHDAIKALSQVCDGAAQQDGQGYNRFDASLGHKFASLETLSQRQARAGYFLLRKYRNQLSEMGIDYAAIAEPETTEEPAPVRRISTSKGKIMIIFAYDADIVSDVRGLPGRRFDRDSKTWSVSLQTEVFEPLLKLAVKHDFEVMPGVTKKIGEIIEKTETALTASTSESADIEIEGLGGELRPFQKAGVAYALNAKRCFIADEMGLGKTVQALATIQAAVAYPALIVCPASLKFNWKKEALKWLPGRSVEVLNGKSVVNGADVTILNYDILKKHFEALRAKSYQSIVFDESHYLKNYKAKRTETAKELSKNIPIRLALTGTPVLNRPQELLSQLGIIDRLNDVGGWWTFAKRYCKAYKSKWGWDLSGADNLEELNTKLRATCFVRRKKTDVLKELPAKQRTTISVEIDNRREYQKAEKELISWLSAKAVEDKDFLKSLKGLSDDEKNIKKSERAEEAGEKAKQAEQLVRIETLKQLSAKGKLKAIQEWVSSFMETDEKLVLFASHIEIQKAILEANPGAAHVLGEDSAEVRQENVEKFQNDADCKLIICSLQAAGVGITLTSASNVAFLELGWTPAIHDQAEDRCHRIGQESQVTAWYLLGQDTIDQDIESLIEEKRQVVDAVTEGKTAQKGASIIKELVKKYTKNNYRAVYRAE